MAGGVRALPATGTDAQLRGSWLLLARVGWIVLAVLILALNALFLLDYFHALQAPCRLAVACFAIHLTASDELLLRQWHLSLALLAGYQVLLDLATVVIYCALGALLFWRRSDDRVALFGAYMLVLFGGVAFTNILQATLAQDGPLGMALTNGLNVLGQSAFLIFFLVFPNGRFVPHWTRWLAMFDVLYWLYVVFFTNLFNSRRGGMNAVFVPLILCIVAAQIYRYWRVSTPRERRQTRWVVFGFAIGILGFVLLIMVGSRIVAPAAHQSQVVATLVGQTGIYGFLLLIPISITIAILRSGLWDIDVIINRTLVYGSLTAILAGVYFAGVYGAQSVLNAFLPTQAVRDSPVLIVASTLLIAALFTPLRRRIQATVDRRFYRRKYDAAKTLAAFGATLRSEVDLRDLTAHLVNVVDETMRPAHVSLWLREPVLRGDRRDHSARALERGGPA